MEDKKNSNSILLTIIGVATLLIALVGATFAYFSATATSADQSIQVGKLNITTSLEEASQKDIIPTKWDDTTMDNNKNNDNIAKFTYKVMGTGTTVRDAVYDVKLTGAVIMQETVNNGVTSSEQGGDKTQVIYKLVKNDQSVIANGNYNDIISGKEIVHNQSITGETNDTYTLYVYIEENNQNQDKLQGATVSATLDATAYTPRITSE